MPQIQDGSKADAFIPFYSNIIGLAIPGKADKKMTYAHALVYGYARSFCMSRRKSPGCFAKPETIALATGLKERTVTDARAELISAGLLEPVRGSHRVIKRVYAPPLSKVLERESTDSTPVREGEDGNISVAPVSDIDGRDVKNDCGGGRKRPEVGTDGEVERSDAIGPPLNQQGPNERDRLTVVKKKDSTTQSQLPTGVSLSPRTQGPWPSAIVLEPQLKEGDAVRLRRPCATGTHPPSSTHPPCAFGASSKVKIDSRDNDTKGGDSKGKDSKGGESNVFDLNETKVMALDMGVFKCHSSDSTSVNSTAIAHEVKDEDPFLTGVSGPEEDRLAKNRRVYGMLSRVKKRLGYAAPPLVKEKTALNHLLALGYDEDEVVRLVRWADLDEFWGKFQLATKMSEGCVAAYEEYRRKCPKFAQEGPSESEKASTSVFERQDIMQLELRPNSESKNLLKENRDGR